MATLDPKTRKKLATVLRREINYRDNAYYVFGVWDTSSLEHNKLPTDAMREINAQMKQWRTAFRKWIKETIK